MVYDLVRPLGASKGEFEVNSLFLKPLRRGRPLEWAPEVEFAFAEGYAIEFEFPFEGTALETWKAALQGTLGDFANHKATHGWQVLGERFRNTGDWKLDLLYLTGTRWHPRWSTFTMAGSRREEKMQSAGWAPLWNQSVFYHYSRKINLGVESNYKGRGLLPPYWLTVPQVTLRHSRYNIQFGAGSRLEERRWRPVVAWRLTREF